jgi:hypothetical protein
MPRQEDPSLPDTAFVLRRIPPWGDRVQWDQDGIPSPSSQNFKDKEEELSVYLEQECTPEAILRGHAGFGVVRLALGRVREICKQNVVVCRDDEEPEFGHVLVCGKITGGMAAKLKACCNWVDRAYWPERLEKDLDQDISNESQS